MKTLYKILFFVTIIITVIVTAFVLGTFFFRRQVNGEIDAIFSSSGDLTDVFTYRQLEGLPEPVQRYFRYSLNDGQKYISYVRLTHAGTFRPSPEQDWMPITGEEYFSVEKPGFLWFASINPVPVIAITARDTYHDGVGNMLIKVASLYTMGDTKGEKMDEGALMRWLAEAIWFPTALLPSERLQWAEVDSDSARATLVDSGINVSLVFKFNAEGQVTEILGLRYRSVGDSFSQDEWVAYCRNYREVDGVMIPYEVEVTWNLDSGVYSYALFTIVEMEYDNPSRFK